MAEEKQKDQQTEQLVDLGAATTNTSRGSIYTLTIVGQIEGHQALPENVKTTKYEHVLPLLASVEEREEIDGLLILLNTVGGDIEAGLAIAELIAGMKKPTVSLVLGGGHSIGIPLAVSARRSMIVPTASMTVHPVRMTGLVVGAPQTYQYFNRIQDQIVSFVTKHSKISKQRFLDYMMATDEIATDVGTVVYGPETVESGLMDQLGSLSDAFSWLHRQIAKEKKKKKSLFPEKVNAGLVLDLAASLPAPLAKLLRRVHIHHTAVRVLTTGSDAAEAAVRAGHTSAAVYSVYLALGRIFTVDYPEILILPDFFREEDNIYAESRVTLRPVALLAFGAGFMIRLVKRRQEREQTNDSSAQAAGADPNETEVQ